MPKYAETIRVRVMQTKAAVVALEYKYRTGRWPNSRWSEGKCLRLANELRIPMVRFTSMFGLLTAMRLWLAYQERVAYANEADNRPPWE